MLIKKKVTKEDILEQVSPVDIFSFYLGKNVKMGQTMRSPLRDNDKHPSFNIYKTPSGQICYKDFAMDSGDCFDFVMKLFNISFAQAITKIANDLTVFEKGTDTSALNFKRTKKPDIVTRAIKCEFDFNFYDNTKVNEVTQMQQYFGQFGITTPTLHYYPVRLIKDFSFVSGIVNNCFMK